VQLLGKYRQASVVVRYRCTGNFHEILIPYHAVVINVGLPKNPVDFLRRQTLAPILQHVAQLLGRDEPLALGVAGLERVHHFLGQILGPRVNVHHLQEVGEGHFATLLLEVAS
jgi:hypothetical protein